MPNWIRRLFARNTPRSKKTKTFRPSVETLEGRIVPTAPPVLPNGIADSVQQAALLNVPADSGTMPIPPIVALGNVSAPSGGTDAGSGTGNGSASDGGSATTADSGSGIGNGSASASNSASISDSSSGIGSGSASASDSGMGSGSASDIGAGTSSGSASVSDNGSGL